MKIELTHEEFIQKAYEVANGLDDSTLRQRAISYLRKQVTEIKADFGPRQPNFLDDDDDDEEEKDEVTLFLNKMAFLIDVIANYKSKSQDVLKKAHAIAEELHTENYKFFRGSLSAIDRETAAAYYGQVLNAYLVTLVLFRILRY